MQQWEWCPLLACSGAHPLYRWHCSRSTGTGSQWHTCWHCRLLRLPSLASLQISSFPSSMSSANALKAVSRMPSLSPTAPKRRYLHTLVDRHWVSCRQTLRFVAGQQSTSVLNCNGCAASACELSAGVYLVTERSIAKSCQPLMLRDTLKVTLVGVGDQAADGSPVNHQESQGACEAQS